MKKIFFALVLAFVLAGSSKAEETAKELHIYTNGDVHLIGASVVHKHSSNLYTVGIWDRKWLVQLEYNAKEYNAKFESAYGAEIKPAELAEGHLLEIKGKLIYSASERAYNQISPKLIKDLNIKTGEPPAPKASEDTAPPPSIPPPPPPPPPPKKAGKLTMALKFGYWGGQVKILQEFLKQQGYFPQAETTSRYFGPLTKNSLIEFQKANALEAVGYTGPKTRSIINSLLAQ